MSNKPRLTPHILYVTPKIKTKSKVNVKNQNPRNRFEIPNQNRQETVKTFEETRKCWKLATNSKIKEKFNLTTQFSCVFCCVFVITTGSNTVNSQKLRFCVDFLENVTTKSDTEKKLLQLITFEFSKLWGWNYQENVNKLMNVTGFQHFAVNIYVDNEKN